MAKAIISLNLDRDVINAIDAQIWDHVRQRAAFGKRSTYIEDILRKHLTSIGVNLYATNIDQCRDFDL